MFLSNFSLLPQHEFIFQYNGIRTNIYPLSGKKDIEWYVYSQLLEVLLLSEKILLKRSVPCDERTQPEEYGLEKFHYCRGRLKHLFAQ